MKKVTLNYLEQVKLIAEAKGHRGDYRNLWSFVYNFAGPGNKDTRQEIMEDLLQRKVKRSEIGVTNLLNATNDWLVGEYGKDINITDFQKNIMNY